MENPLNPPIVVPFQGKTYNCDFTLAALTLLEGELNLSIMAPGHNSLWTKPDFYRLTVTMYCLLRSTPLKGVTLERCAAEMTGPNFTRLKACCEEAFTRFQGQIVRLQEHIESANPTEAPSTGQDSGPSES